MLHTEEFDTCKNRHQEIWFRRTEVCPICRIRIYADAIAARVSEISMMILPLIAKGENEND